MCMGGGAKAPSKPTPEPVPEPKAPVAAPNADTASVAKVETGNQSKDATERRKVGRSQLRQASSTSTGQNKSGLGG